MLLEIITGSNTDFENYLLDFRVKTSISLTTAADANWAKIFSLKPDGLPLSTAPGNTDQRKILFLESFLPSDRLALEILC